MQKLTYRMLLKRYLEEKTVRRIHVTPGVKYQKEDIDWSNPLVFPEEIAKELLESFTRIENGLAEEVRWDD